MDQNDSEKLSILYRLYEQPMYRIAYAVLHDVSLAEDAVSDAFMKIIPRLHKLGEPDSPKTKAYIVKVIKSVSIDQYRRCRKRYCHEQAIDEYALQIPDASQDIASFEDSDSLQKALLADLSDADRDMIKLRCLDGLSWKETSQKLSISETTLRKRFERARKRLISMKGDTHDE